MLDAYYPFAKANGNETKENGYFFNSNLRTYDYTT